MSMGPVSQRAQQETPHTVVSPSPPNTNRVITPNLGRRLFKGSTAARRALFKAMLLRHSFSPARQIFSHNKRQSLWPRSAPSLVVRRSADSIDSSGPTDLTEMGRQNRFRIVAVSRSQRSGAVSLCATSSPDSRYRFELRNSAVSFRYISGRYFSRIRVALDCPGMY